MSLILLSKSDISEKVTDTSSLAFAPPHTDDWHFLQQCEHRGTCEKMPSDPYVMYGSYIFNMSRASRTHPPSSGRDLNGDDNCGRFRTFAVSVWTSEDCALLDDAIGLEEAVDVLLRLLFVQHPHKQLPVFCNTHTHTDANTLIYIFELAGKGFIIKSRAHITRTDLWYWTPNVRAESHQIIFLPRLIILISTITGFSPIWAHAV